MSQSLTCKCGKKLASKQSIAGKRVKCPACGAVFEALVTATGSTASKLPPAPPLPAIATSTKPVVFVSHSAKDKAAATSICSTLEQQGLRCWIAPRDIVPGTEWGEAIIEGISSCRFMVLIFSGHSNESPQVRREVERAVSKGLIIIPFRIEDVPMAKSLEYFLSSPHWLDALTRPLEPHIHNLAATIHSLLRDGTAKSTNKATQRVTRPLPAPKSKWTSRKLGLIGASVGTLALALVVILLLNNRRKPEASQGQQSQQSQQNPTDHDQVAKAPVIRTGNPSKPTYSPSEVPLRDGTLQVRSLRLEAFPGPLPKTDEKAAPPKWVIVSNQENLTKGRDSGKARLHFQITNNSYEAVTLANVELALLGVVELHEDRIPEPIAPQIVGTIQSREVPFGPKVLSDFANVKTTIVDSNDPPSPLRFEVTTDLPDMAQPTLDSENRLQVALSGKKGGTATITLRAVNAFDFEKAVSFTIRSEPRPPVVLKRLDSREIEVSGPRALSDVADVKALFADTQNDPPTALKFEVTSDQPDLAQPSLDAQNRLQIFIPGKKNGSAQITIRATNAYNLSEAVSFAITVRVTTLVVDGKNQTIMVIKTDRPAQITPNPVLQMPIRPIDTKNPANVPQGIGKFEVDKETLRLTNVHFAHSFKRNEILRPCLSGNLLPQEEETFLKANSGKKVSVDLSCPSEWNLPANLAKDLLVGTRQRQLSARSPNFIGACHLVALKVEILGEDGKRQEVYGDRVYALYSSAAPDDGMSNQPNRVVPVWLSHVDDKDLDQVISSLLKWSLKTNEETVAFQRAKLCGSLPEKLDPLTIGSACFYGDRNSLLRSQTVSLPASVPAEVWPRTNLISVLKQARTEHPNLAKLLDASLAKLSASSDATLSRRASHVSAQLRSATPTAALVESKPPRPVPMNE